jgi:hypothetical protein
VDICHCSIRSESICRAGMPFQTGFSKKSSLTVSRLFLCFSENQGDTRPFF